MPVRKNVFKTAGLLFLALIVTSCKDYVTIGINPWPPCELWYLTEKLGINEKNGLEVKLVRYPTWRSSIEAFYEGTTDITHSSYFNAVYYCNRGRKGKIAVVSDSILGADGMVLSKSINSIDMLKGRKIGVEVGTDEYFLLYRILKNHSLSLDDVEVISMKSIEAPEYLASGRVSAVVTYRPYLTRCLENGRLFETTYQYPDILKDVIMVSERIYRSRRITGKVKKSWFETIEWLSKSSKNFEYGVDLMADVEGMGKNEFRIFFRSFYFFSKEDSKNLLKRNGRAENILKEIQYFSLSEGIIKKKCNIDELILR